MDRAPGLSARLKLTLSYTGFLMVAGGLLIAVIWWSILRYIPDGVVYGGLPWIPPQRSDPLNGFGLPAVAALLLLLVFGLVGGWLLAGRMLAPLTRITAATRRATTGSLSHRIELEGRKDEFRELADSFDAMLARLEAHVAEQQRFAANASHELRTPLTITQTLLDVARKDPHRDTAALIDRLRVVNTRAIDLTEALLVLSRADRRSFTREPVDLSLLVEEAAETLLTLAAERGVTITTSGAPTPTVGAPALLLQMCTNLVHNAIVHNLTAGGTVTVHAGSEHGTSVLRVENTGPSVAPEVVPTLTERFQRGAERARTGEHAGVGLGLAIVDSIVRAHDGTLDLAPRPAGGLVVTIRLPGAPQAPGARATASRLDSR